MKTQRLPTANGSATPFAAGLTVRQRATCILAWSDRLTQAQIAAVQGLTINAVKRRLQSARRRLRAAGIEPPGATRHLHRHRAQLLALVQNV